MESTTEPRRAVSFANIFVGCIETQILSKQNIL